MQNIDSVGTVSQIQLFVFICIGRHCVEYVVPPHVVVPVVVALAGEPQAELNLCISTQLSTLEKK